MEEQQFLQEMEEKKETTLERQAKMREKAKVLRDKRESERQQLVSEKLEQQFRYCSATYRSPAVLLIIQSAQSDVDSLLLTHDVAHGDPVTRELMKQLKTAFLFSFL